MLESYSWLWWIIIGGIAGGIAKLLMPGRDPGGCLVTILLGIAGAITICLVFWIYFVFYLLGRGCGQTPESEDRLRLPDG